jgi:hypothetical protein
MTSSLRVACRLAALLLLAPCVGLRVAAAQSCVADCDGDREVAVNELISCVNLAIDPLLATPCAACDPSGDDQVGINELIAGVNNALSGCVSLDLPDLEPVTVRLSSTTPACINDTSEIQLGLEVCVANRGSVASGPFVIALLGEEFQRVAALAANTEACFVGPFEPFDLDVLVDADEQVAESDESNNFATFFVPQPTPPAFCTATPTVTDTPSETETSSATVTATETPSATATASGTVTPPATTTATGTVTPPATTTATVTVTPPATFTATDTATPVPTATQTLAPTDTATSVPSATPTAVATDTATPTDTTSPSATATATGSATPTQSDTPSSSPTDTDTPTATPTGTPE